MTTAIESLLKAITETADVIRELAGSYESTDHIETVYGIRDNVRELDKLAYRLLLEEGKNKGNTND